MPTSWRERLGRHIEKGIFVPFIGAGVSAARDQNTLVKLLNGPPEDDSCSCDLLRCTPGALSAYRYGMMKASRKDNRSACALLDGLAYGAWLRNEGKQETEDWPGLYAAWSTRCERCGEFNGNATETAARQLRESVLDLLALLDTFAGSDLQASCSIIPLVGGMGVTLTPERRYELREPLSRCLSHAKEVESILESRDELALRLCPSSLYKALLCLTSDIFTGDYNWVPEEHRDRVAREHPVGQPGLDGTSTTANIGQQTLAWLVQLLWHLCRYDDPLLPTSQELAFRLTLKLNYPKPIVGDLAQVAELIEADCGSGNQDPELPEAVNEVIRSWISFCHNKAGTNVTDCYSALANAVGRTCGAKDATDNRTSQEVLRKYPLVFTTNYDESIERALCYATVREWDAVHVLFPICCCSPSGATKSTLPPDLCPPEGTSRPVRQVAWACQTRQCNAMREQTVTKIFWQPGDANQAGRSGSSSLNLVDHLKRRLEYPGPVVLHLHGAPTIALDELRNANGDLRSASETEQWHHMTLITETGYVQVLAEARSRDMPLAALSQVQADFGLWFLGYSLSDWNIRSQLYLQIRPPVGSSRAGRNAGERFAIMHSVDPLKEAHCKALEIGAVAVPLHHFFGTLADQ